MANATSKKKSAAKKATAATKSTKARTNKKNTAAKNAVSKTSKRSSKKQTTGKDGKVLICANDGECFWTTDGQVLRDLVELRDALQAMEEEVFAHHVNTEKNDFADWVEQVLDDVACAAALRKARKPKTARTVIVRHLRTYTI